MVFTTGWPDDVAGIDKAYIVKQHVVANTLRMVFVYMDELMFLFLSHTWFVINFCKQIFYLMEISMERSAFPRDLPLSLGSHDCLYVLNHGIL